MELAAFLIEMQRNKIPYYLRNIVRQVTPRLILDNQIRKYRKSLERMPRDKIVDRLNYYNRLTVFSVITENVTPLDRISEIDAPSAYLFDSLQYTRYFPRNLKGIFLFGDIIHTPITPSIQKSRPISSIGGNAVLLNLDKKRHFLFVDDPIPLNCKKDMLIGRGTMTQSHRIAFMEKYFGEPRLNLGQVNKGGGNPAWIKPKISILEHLKYKFILSLEGNDVATNLKWIMSSNSVAVMPEPKYETWFMEGRLIPNVHYIRIKDDYSDLLDRLEYYIEHPSEVKEIVQNANLYVKQFQNREEEDIISLLVLDKYFYYTSQTTSRSILI